MFIFINPWSSYDPDDIPSSDTADFEKTGPDSSLTTKGVAAIPPAVCIEKLIGFGRADETPPV